LSSPSNPYGPRPGGGISLPDYYRPPLSISNRNVYFPGTELLPQNEMRISFLGSTPFPPTKSQSGTCIMLELGTGAPQPRRFFFDLGSGAVRNALAMQVPPALFNDIFITHLHVDHYADLPYMHPFTAWMGRFQPLRVYGPSGSRPELGTKHMIKHMREMLVWHEENFDAFPIGDGYEIEVTEFDWTDDNGICYDHDGVVIRHWPRSHGKNGASAYRLDWEEADLSFVWTGDGRPDEKTAEYGKGADVFVSEGQLDTPALQAMSMGMSQEMIQYTTDGWHTLYYGAGYLFNEVQPRMAAICHYGASGGAKEAEALAEIRSHWDGLFMFTGPDVQVLNVTKDAIWNREAALPDGAAIASLDPRWLVPPGAALPDEIALPQPKLLREDQQDASLRDMEIDPHLYYPPDVEREQSSTWPEEGIRVNPKEMLKARGIDVDDEASKPD
jgi:ribonuclease Z